MKVCFAGLGSIGKRHIKNLVKVLDQRNIPYCIDAYRSGKSELPNDISSLLNKEYNDINRLPKDYDIIFITNPTWQHYDTIQCLKNNTKHMFIEKPIFESVNYNLTDLFLKPAEIYYVACPLRFTPVIRYIKDIIQNEKVFSVRAISSSYLPEWRKGVDYRKIYSASKAQGGGVSLDLIHEWDYISYLFGFPEKVYNINGHYSDLEIDSDDISVYIAEYKDKLAEIHLDYLGRSTVRKLELYCKDYVIYADLIKNEIVYTGMCNKTVKLDQEDMYINEMNYFLDMIEGKAVNNNDISHAYKVLELASANK